MKYNINCMIHINHYNAFSELIESLLFQPQKPRKVLPLE